MPTDARMMREIALDGLFNKLSLEEILQRLSSCLGISLSITDLNFNRILSYPEQAQAASGPIRPDGGRGLGAFFRSGEPAPSPVKAGRWLCPVVIGGTPFGTAAAECLYGRADSALLREAARLTADLAQKLMRPDVYLSPFNALPNYILTNYLFLGGSDEELGSALDSLRAPHAMASFRGCDRERLRAADSALERYLPGSVHMVNGDRLDAFLSGLLPQSMESGSVLRSQLESFCRTFGLTAAVSDQFSSLNDRGYYLNQAQALLDLGAEPGEALLAGEHFSELIFHSAQKRYGGGYLLLGEILRLEEYDAVHKTDYLDSLREYIASCCRVATASKQLFIDHSTMIYRLRKIAAITETDLEDASTLAMLRISLIAYRIMHRS